MDKIESKEFRLVGLKLQHKTTNEGGQSGIDCGNLWQKFENEKFPDKITDKISDDIYAVYFDYDGDHTQPFSYFIGCKVESGSVPPDGMYSLTIPSGSFTRVLAKGKMPDCVANSWKDIWKSGIDRAYKYDFEIYDQRSKDWSNAAVDIFVSCKN
jgi:predicted transcriptional regulator YdeE